VVHCLVPVDLNVFKIENFISKHQQTSPRSSRTDQVSRRFTAVPAKPGPHTSVLQQPLLVFINFLGANNGTNNGIDNGGCFWAVSQTNNTLILVNHGD
jgi:hypothetical protein